MHNPRHNTNTTFGLKVNLHHGLADVTMKIFDHMTLLCSIVDLFDKEAFFFDSWICWVNANSKDMIHNVNNIATGWDLQHVVKE